MQSQNRPVRVLWCVYDPSAAHWGFVIDAIKKVDPMPVILGSKRERPNIAFEAKNFAEMYEIEAVMCVSNRKVTESVVREVKRCGRAGYGAVFDS